VKLKIGYPARKLKIGYSYMFYVNFLRGKGQGCLSVEPRRIDCCRIVASDQSDRVATYAG